MCEHVNRKNFVLIPYGHSVISALKSVKMLRQDILTKVKFLNLSNGDFGRSTLYQMVYSLSSVEI